LTTYEASNGGDALKNLGFEIGKDFIQEYRRSRIAVQTVSTDVKDLLNSTLEYDSSSGMGKFDLISSATNPLNFSVKINVTNPFVEERDPNKLSPFLVGYLLGVCSAIFNANFTARADDLVVEWDNRIFSLSLNQA
jgi:hypothetical protein